MVKAAADKSAALKRSSPRKRKAAAYAQESGSSDNESEVELEAASSSKRKAPVTANTPSKAPKIARSAESVRQDATVSNRLIEPMLPQRPFRLTAPAPTRERKTREFVFDDEVAVTLKFRPNVSPEEMLRLGVFGGSYFRPYWSKKLDREFHEDWIDLPKEWYEGLDVDKMLTNSEYNPQVCRWKVKVGQSIEDWEKAGWIDHTSDVRGWFQWYCRYFMGRRCDDDERQIKRWLGVAGPRGRWRTIYLGKYVNSQLNSIPENEEKVSPGIRQTLLHWAFEVTTTHLNLYKIDKGVRVPNEGDSQDEADDSQ